LVIYHVCLGGILSACPVFEDGKLGMTPWSSGNKGTFTIEKGNAFSGTCSAHLKGVTFGSIGLNVEAKPGELYYVRVKGKDHSKNSGMNLGVHWTANRNTRVDFEQPEQSGWRSADFAVFAPDGFDKIYFSAGVQPSSKDGCDCSFDDFEIYRID